MIGVKKKSSTESVNSKFMATVPDHLLLEILIRLPRLGPAITVCKSWHSLIISDHPDTFLRHTRHHHRRRQNCDPDPSYTPPCTLLLGDKPFKPCLQILSEKSKILETALSRQSPQNTLLGFVSDLNSGAIKASFYDSLLLHLNGEYRIYKPVTNEQLLIPNPPDTPSVNEFSIKLILVGLEEPNGISRFRVVKFQCCEWMTPDSVMVFSSETGEWNQSVQKVYPRNQVVATGGALYWQEELSGICVYDPFCQANDPSSCRIVKFPFGFAEIPSYCRVTRLGAVRGRFRLSQIRHPLQDWSFSLRIWEWKKNGNDDDRWSLVHEILLKSRIERQIIDVVAFHPEDGDVIFVSQGIAIYKCQLKDEGERFQKVGEVSVVNLDRLEILHILLKVFYLVHDM